LERTLERGVDKEYLKKLESELDRAENFWAELLSDDYVTAQPFLDRSGIN